MTESDPIALLQADQRQRWRRGERVPVEFYLDRHDEIGSNPEAVLDLIYNEIMLREEAGDGPHFPDYGQRFPHLADQIRLLFEVHEVLERGALGDAQAMGRLDPEFAVERSITGLPLVPGYEILAELGRGGLGVVYKARQGGLNRLVALKVIVTGAYANPRPYERLRAESEIIGLQHPNIVQVFQIEDRDGRPCFSLELVQGGSLKARLGATPHSASEAARLVETLARAAGYAHHRGILHRALSPNNIFLNAGTPKIADFGVAQFLDAVDGPTRAGLLPGSPNYTAPELAAGRAEEIGPAVDIYSLGAILYEMLTGRPPFEGKSAREVLEKLRTEEPVSPRRLHPRVPTDLETICLKCLEKDRLHRYGSAAELADDLARFLRDEPVRARPVTAWMRGVRWARRRLYDSAVGGLLRRLERWPARKPKTSSNG